MIERPLGDPEIAVEILRLRVAELEEAIRRLADQDATLSVCDGSVTVTMDAPLTDAEVARLRLEAAAEIKRLRGSTVEQRFCEPPVAGSTPAAGFLTDAEREAVEWFACMGLEKPHNGPVTRQHSATLRGLLARCATGHQE